MGQHKGVFPCDFEAVLDLPGIGRYTAGAICSIAFGQPRPILDGNVARVLSRVFTVRGDPREKSTAARLWDLAERLVSGAAAMQPGRSSLRNRTQCGSFNEALMELGALVCLPQAPRCDICPISAHCRAWLRNVVNRFPERAARFVATRRRLVVFVVRKGDAILIRQRPHGVPNAGFWELPFVEALDGEPGKVLFRKVISEGGWGLKPIGKVSHTIMNSRFDVEAFEAQKVSASPITGHRNQCSSLAAFRSIRFEVLDSVPLSTISRKVLGLLRKTAQGRTSRKKTTEARSHGENG
jgi:A/G-specific adenine glycosylase